jgi:hypothetical protein
MNRRLAFVIPWYSENIPGGAESYWASYFSTSLSPGAGFEMHVLPQSTVFEIAEDEGCRVLEVQPDNCVGAAHWISNTFPVRKITPKFPR